MQKQTVVSKNVTLYPSDWAIVQEIASDSLVISNNNVSHALRYIIRDWKRRKEAESALVKSEQKNTPPE